LLPVGGELLFESDRARGSVAAASGVIKQRPLSAIGVFGLPSN